MRYRNRPRGRKRLIAPILALGLLGLLSVEPRSIYDARLTDAEVRARLALRELPPR
jgi:hypothetical protein